MSNVTTQRWMFAALIVLLSLAVSAPLHANPGIAIVMSDDSVPYQAMLEGFQKHLRDKGVQADYEIFHIQGKSSKAALLAEKMEQRDDELIYCLGTLACQSAQRLTLKRPVVASLMLSPRSISLDAQTTGVFFSYSPKTQLQWLKKLFPQFKTVGVIYNPEQNQALIDKAVGIARQLGIELLAFPINTPKQLPAALNNLLRKVDILWALPDKTVLAPPTAKQVLLTSFRNHIPVIGASAPWVKGGALYALDWDYADLGAQNAAMALKILKGVSINNIPVTEPRSVAYTLNLKTAKYMKLNIPAVTTQGAKHVYQ